MRDLSQLEQDLKALSVEEKLEIALWLLDEAHLAVRSRDGAPSESGATPSPDYEARLKTIFGDRILPNMVLEDRASQRW